MPSQGSDRSSADPPVSTPSPDCDRSALWRRRPLAAFGAVAAGALGGALLVGFVAFSAAMPHGEPALAARAEGIVALTGDSSRVQDALALLAAGRARRLLITGVNPTTTAPEIAAATPKFRYLFKCCIDLGYEAVNTAGNAVEARDWAKREGFRHSLIVVTSTYHMRRALAEMGAAMPRISLIPYPVGAQEFDGKPWWGNLRALRLLGREYVKYIFAVTRMALEPSHAPAPAPPADIG